MTKKEREEIEYFLCTFLDALDPTKGNSEHYQEKWASMSDAQFIKWLSKEYPLQFYLRTWDVMPSKTQFKKASKIIDVPLLGKVALPYYYENKDGVPVNSKDGILVRLPLKKVQQMLTKKTKIAINIDDRDMNTGRLNGADKGANTSDREVESLAIAGLDHTLEEFTTIKADAMDAKSVAYNTISTTGTLSAKDYEINESDSLSRNLVNAYLQSCHFSTNLVNKDGYTPYTLKEHTKKTQRIE